MIHCRYAYHYSFTQLLRRVLTFIPCPCVFFPLAFAAYVRSISRWRGWKVLLPEGSPPRETLTCTKAGRDRTALPRTIRSPVGLLRLSLSSTWTECSQMMHHAVIFGGEKINFFTRSLFAFQSALVVFASEHLSI